MTRVGELAAIVRSKNAEPFITTVDLVFDKPEDYERARNSEEFTKARVAELYRLPPEGVYGIFFIDGLQAIKISFFKYGRGAYFAIGDSACADMYGAQQHIPLMEVEI